MLQNELHLVERMIRAFGVIFNLWLFSNFKCVRNDCCLIELSSRIINASGPLLVSRTGDVGCSNRVDKALKSRLI